MLALETLDVSNFNTSNAYNFGNMFVECHSLKSLNLSSFDSSNVRYIDKMFKGCNSLEKLDLSNFNTSSVELSHNMFKDCFKLKSLDISHFNTSKITDMNNMFYNCYSLTSLELGNLNTTEVTNMTNMFYNCYSLTSLNLNSFSTLKANSYSNMFFNITNLKYCINDEVEQIKNQVSSFIELNCSELCYKDSTNKFIKEKNKCINDCTLDNTYNFEYDNICYISCPNNTYLINHYYCEKVLICDNYYNHNHTACLDEIPLGYYLNDTIKKTIDKCIIKCSNCTIESISNELCISCNNNENYYPKLNDDINDNLYIDCYSGEQIGYFLDNEINTYKPCYSKCKKCSREGNDEHHQCNECINSSYLLDDNGNCEEIINNNKLKFNYNPTEWELETIKFCNGSIYSYNIKSNMTKLKEIYNNVTFINFLRDNYHFLYEKFHLNNETDNIYVVIIDYLCKGNRIATSDYIVKFFLENNTELSLDEITEDLYFDIYVPIKVLELGNFNYSKYFSNQGYDIYNKSSDFYNDFCSAANLGDNDITLNDRKKYIYPNNVTLCKDNCKYNGVDLDKEIIICSCNLNKDINGIKNEENFLYENGNFFTYLLDNINYNIFKCYKLLSSFNNLKNNYSFYGILGFFFSIITLNFIFIFRTIPTLRRSMLLQVIRKEHLIQNVNITRELKKDNSLNNPSYKTKVKKIKIQRKINSKKKRKIYFLRNNTKNVPQRKRILTQKKKNFNSPSIGNLIHTNNNEIILNNDEINELPFSQAIIIDKRNILIILISIIIRKIEIINLFCGKEKIKIMLVCEYILSFLLNFFFNALLYSDEVVSNKYHNNGQLDIFITLLLSISSNVITSIFCYYMNYSDGIEERAKNIRDIRIEYYYLINVNAFIKYLKLKFISFFLCEIILISGCYYYIVIFCIVYRKSKGSLMVNYILSLVEGLITSLAITFIIVITRKIGLSCNNKYIYNTSKFINDKF